jgi:hypothetical protein
VREALDSADVEDVAVPEFDDLDEDSLLP